VTASEYVGTVSPALTSSFEQVQQRATAVLQASTGTGVERATAIEEQVLPSMRELLSAAEQVTSADADVSEAHRHFVACIRLEVAAFELLSKGLREGDRSAVAAGVAKEQEATNELRQWASLVQVLALG
jgi:hypothetical protein